MFHLVQIKQKLYFIKGPANTYPLEGRSLTIKIFDPATMKEISTLGDFI